MSDTSKRSGTKKHKFGLEKSELNSETGFGVDSLDFLVGRLPESQKKSFAEASALWKRSGVTQDSNRRSAPPQNTDKTRGNERGR